MFVGMVFFSKAEKDSRTNKTQIMKKSVWLLVYEKKTRLCYIFWGYCFLHFICIKLTLSCLSDWLADWLTDCKYTFYIDTRLPLFIYFFSLFWCFYIIFLVLVNATQFANFYTELTVVYRSIKNSIFRWKSKNRH